MKTIMMESNRSIKTRWILIFAFIISHIAVFLSDTIAIFDYIATIIIFFVIAVFCGLRIKREKAIIVLFMALAMFGGLIMSYILCKDNSNFPLAIIIVINVMMYMILAYDNNSYLESKDVDFIMIFFIVVGVVSCIYNLFLNWSEIGSLSTSSYSYGAIFSAFYSGRNSFASCLYIYIMLAVYQLFTKNRKKRVLYTLIVLLFSINLFFTFSRTAIASTILGVGLFVYLMSRRTIIKRAMFLTGVICVFVFGLIVFFNNEEFISHFLIRAEYKDAYRSLYWGEAIDNIWMSPIFGYGPGAAEVILKHLNSLSSSSFHNAYVEIVMWGGIILAFAYIMLGILLIRSIKKTKRTNSSFYYFYISFFVSFCVSCLFESSMFFALGFRGHFNTIVLFLIPILYAKKKGGMGYVAE